MRRLTYLIIGSTLAFSALADEHVVNGHKFKVPTGFEVKQVAGQPLVERPVSADFDELGRLYVTDSSGSNESVQVQNQKRPHRIMRLEDVDGDGIFDNSTVFADKLMFPEGSTWFDGSLYVAAPPEIWKFTDADDDGVAESREIWFDGKTLTHCANDLHGPYLGPDGWMYWCKGAFAEQTHTRPGKSDLVTKAAHIFRRRPSGGPIEVVMTGGMDNPVELVFTPGGERIFTTTFLVHPHQGKRDGLIHAVYGGVYGKDHAVLKGHPRTGDLLPALSHLGAAAPCGLSRLESSGLGPEYRDNVLACLFNMHKISRHVLTKHGATFHSETSDLLVSDNLDFHPTDVLEDADGTVLVVDTGGWFRLCCPTSQLEKPDVMGGIYRIQRKDAQKVDDPRGLAMDWSKFDPDQLVELLDDKRFAVRIRARRRIGAIGSTAIKSLMNTLQTSGSAHHRLQCVWALTWIDDGRARAAVRKALDDKDETVRQAALHSISAHQDTQALDRVTSILSQGSPHNRRAAAEVVGRVGAARDISLLLSSIPNAVTKTSSGKISTDRFQEHSLIYAAIELNDSSELRKLASSTNVNTQRAAIIALDQLNGNAPLRAAEIAPLLSSSDKSLKETAWWIAEHHPEWGNDIEDAMRHEIASARSDIHRQQLGARLKAFIASPGIQQLLADTLLNESTSDANRITVLETMAESRHKPMPTPWAKAMFAQLAGNHTVVRATLMAMNQFEGEPLGEATLQRLEEIAFENNPSPEIRLRALVLLPDKRRNFDQQLMSFLSAQLNIESSVENRGLAVDILKSTPLNSAQLRSLAGSLPEVGSMELQPLLTVFAKSKDTTVGTSLVASLLKSPAAKSLFPDKLKSLLQGFGDSLVAQAAPLMTMIEHENQNKLERVEAVLALLPKADVRRGLRVFQSTRASCIACHTRGYIGGSIGPDLNRIGQIRTERALIESILFPSMSFVRSFESTIIATDDGRTHSGMIRHEDSETVTLQLDAQKTIVLPTASIEERQQSPISIMPDGLEKQISPQDLADLVKYLKEG